MNSNWTNGEVNISDRLTIHQRYSFDEFKESSFYKNQDGKKEIIECEIIYVMKKN